MLLGSIVIAAPLVENNFELTGACDRKGRVLPHGAAEDDVVSLALGEKGKDRFVCGIAMRGKMLADERSNREDGASSIGAIKADDAATAGNSENGGFFGAAGEFEEKGRASS